MLLGKIRKFGNFLFFGLVMLFYFECILLIVLIMLFLTIIRFNKAKILIKRIWIHLTMSALGCYFPKPMFVYYDTRILEKTKNVVISNHLSEFDWLMILTILYRLNRFDNICIILKNSLQNIPLLGYGMKYFGFIFLNRKIEKDRQIIHDGVERLKNDGEFDLLLFPEGTYLDAESSPVCKKYMERNPAFLDQKEFVPEEVLLPRVTGFDLIRRSLLQGNGISPSQGLEGVIDITLLVNPYKKFPQDDYSYSKTLTDFNDRIGFVFYLDYVENIKDKDFIFRRFKIKEELITRFKELDMPEIKTEVEFRRLTKLLKKDAPTHKYKTIYVKSDWGPFFYILFIFTCFMLLYKIKC